MRKEKELENGFELMFWKGLGFTLGVATGLVVCSAGVFLVALIRVLLGLNH